MHVHCSPYRVQDRCKVVTGFQQSWYVGAPDTYPGIPISEELHSAVYERCCDGGALYLGDAPLHIFPKIFQASTWMLEDVVLHFQEVRPELAARVTLPQKILHLFSQQQGAIIRRATLFDLPLGTVARVALGTPV